MFLMLYIDKLSLRLTSIWLGTCQSKIIEYFKVNSYFNSLILSGFLQYIVYLFLYIRCIRDDIGSFVDFCSVANVSMFIMTHAQYGYYIHGRSPHGNADTGMQQMARALLKEETGFSTKMRGLEEGSDHQTFSISISGKLSKQYTNVMSPLYEVTLQTITQLFLFNRNLI